MSQTVANIRTADPLQKALLDFHALPFYTADDADVAAWAFDLLFHDGRECASCRF